MRLDRQHIAFVLHRRVESQAALGQHGLCLGRSTAQQLDTIGSSNIFSVGQSRGLHRFFQIATGKFIVGIASWHTDRPGMPTAIAACRAVSPAK
jgi:hypothetical protein